MVRLIPTWCALVATVCCAAAAVACGSSGTTTPGNGGGAGGSTTPTGSTTAASGQNPTFSVTVMLTGEIPLTGSFTDNHTASASALGFSTNCSGYASHGDHMNTPGLFAVPRPRDPSGADPVPPESVGGVPLWYIVGVSAGQNMFHGPGTYAVSGHGGDNPLHQLHVGQAHFTAGEPDQQTTVTINSDGSGMVVFSNAVNATGSESGTISWTCM